MFATPEIASALRTLFSFAKTSESRLALEAALAVVTAQYPAAAHAAVPAVVPPPPVPDRFGIDCVSSLPTISFPPDYHPPCDAQNAILQCGLSGVTNLPFVAKEAVRIATDRLAAAAARGQVCLEPDLAVAIAAYTYDLGFSSTDATGAGSDNFYWCLNAALHQRAQNGGALMKLKPILYYLFRGLEALPAAVDKVVYRGVPSSCAAVVQEKYLTGTDVYWTAFTSASDNMATPFAFASSERVGGVIFRITSLTGRYVKRYSSIPREGEVIFSPNSSFTVFKGPHNDVLPNGVTMCVVDLIERPPGQRCVLTRNSMACKSDVKLEKLLSQKSFKKSRR